jgi:transcriptional regulator with XRE-family HTH domain
MPWTADDTGMNAASALLEMTPRQALDALHEGTGLSEEELADALGTSHRTLQRWRAGTAYPQQLARQRLAELLRLQQRVRETFEGADAVHRWFHSQSRYLGGITPAEAIRVGRLDRAEAALEALDSGVFL